MSAEERIESAERRLDELEEKQSRLLAGQSVGEKLAMVMADPELVERLRAHLASEEDMPPAVRELLEEVVEGGSR